MKPRIALVHDWLTNMAGSEQVLLALHELFPEAPIFTSLYNKEKTPQFAKATIIPSYLQRFSYFQNHHQIAIPLMPLAFESFNLKEFDVIISVGNGLSKGVITYPGQVHISYCNTPMRYLWRIGNDRRSEGVIRSRLSHKLRLWDVVSADRVDRFVANSETVKERIAKIYRKEAEVVYPPVDIEQFQLVETPGKYFLAFGRLVSYKRTDLIIEACIKTKQSLVVAGTGPEEGKLRKFAQNAPWISFLGWVADDKKQGLYAGAKALIFAAEEDFGIVPVEAMAVGRPVIAYGRGGVAESVKEGLSGSFFSEQTVASLVDKLQTFSHSEYIPNKIRTEAERFSKKNFQTAMSALVSAEYERIML